MPYFIEKCDLIQYTYEEDSFDEYYALVDGKIIRTERKEILMDIGSKGSYPANKLSNFAPNGFTIDGVECASMEGFLQSLKFKNPDMQVEICKLVGIGAKRAGANKNWKRTQTLYWRGVEYKRDSKEYQELLNRAYNELSKNSAFRKALLSTSDATLTHSIGKSKMNDTVLTKQEFCSRLMSIRRCLQLSGVQE